MKRVFDIFKRLAGAFALAAALLSMPAVSAHAGVNLPGHVFVGGQKQHVQGIAYDAEADCMYMSFTSRFLKVDMQGNILASIDKIQGHLGAMTFDPKDRKVYASLECKDDIIGQGIAKVLSVDVVKQSVFYIAIIDVDKLDKIGADPEDGEILKTVCVRDACADYDAKVNVGGTDLEHRFGCSGIDGVAIAPAVGGGATKFSDARKLYLYVAYGIYGDLARKDNDYQVILKYDLASLAKWAKPVVFGQIHVSGPKRPAAKYFVYTGNTNWGVQNLAYDESTGNFFMAVYKGKKPEYPNYDLYAFSIDQKPFKAALAGVPYFASATQLKLNDNLGVEDPATGIRGWRFKWGSTGLNPLGDGLWYISRNAKNKATGEQSCDAVLYRWTGVPEKPFEEVRK